MFRPITVSSPLKFDKVQTNIAKGIAILMLLWHHTFFNRDYIYDRFQSLYRVKGIPIECYIGSFLKICVAVFLVLSGYGLYKSWCSYQRKLQTKTVGLKDQIRFVKNRLLKLLFGFWFIYLIFVSLSIPFGISFWETYEGNLLYGVIDFLGLANLFSTPTMNPTWWFMGTIIVYYLLFPLLVKLLSYSGEVLLALSVLLLVFPGPDVGELRTWLLPFVMGMYFAEYDLFTRLDAKLNSFIKRILMLGSLIALPLFLGEFKLGSIFAVFIICISCMIISRIPILNKVLEILGCYSSVIFMTHTFILNYYINDFIYGLKYSPLIFAVLTVICLAVAIAVEWLKKLVRLDKLVAKCTG